MIKNIELSKDNYKLLESKENYFFLYKKFKDRIKEEKIDSLLNSMNDKNIDIFCDIMIQNNKKQYMLNFYSNLEKIKIIKNKLVQKLLFDNELSGGSVIGKRNIYFLLGRENESFSLTPYHELLHILTIKIEDKKTSRLGLQYNDFAMGLNEGYTEVLTKRYFGFLGNDDYNAYEHFTWFIDMLENIIGRERMESFYFDCNLEGLILELEKYISRDEVLNFINNIDLLFNGEEEIFNYRKNYLNNGKKMEDIDFDVCFNTNQELINKIYNTFLEINESKEKIEGIKTNFKEKNDLIRNKIYNEEETYQEFFKNDNKTYIKK